MSLLSLLLAPVAVPPVQLLAWQRAIAGISAYCAATVVSSPIDVVKCRAQLKQHGRPNRGVGGIALSMLNQEGPLIFFSGIGPALLMAPAAMVQYTLMDPLREVMPLFAAALIAGTLDILIKCPFERLKTQLQSGASSEDSIIQMLRCTYKSAGVAGLWAGLGATLVRASASHHSHNIHVHPQCRMLTSRCHDHHRPEMSPIWYSSGSHMSMPRTCWHRLARSATVQTSSRGPSLVLLQRLLSHLQT